MHLFRLLGMAAFVAGPVAAGLFAACVIDDDVVYMGDGDTGTPDVGWDGGETENARCIGGCTMEPSADYSCDTSLACDADCAGDWDCDEGLAGGGDAGPPGGDADAGEGDVRDDESCTTRGGGTTIEAAERIAMGSAQVDLIACPTVSSWFRFEAATDESFAVEIIPEAGEITLRVYGDADAGVMDAADLTGAGEFRATAAPGGTFFLRIRAVGADPVEYSLRLYEPPAGD